MGKQGNSLTLAMVALKWPADIGAGPWLEHLLKEGDTPELTGDGILSFNTPKGWVAVSSMERPIAWGDLEAPCASSFMWPDARAVLKQHNAHLLVSISDPEADAIDRSLQLTQVIAALTEEVEAAGIFWGAGGVVQSPEIFRENAQGATRELLPLYLWISFRVGRNKDNSWWGYTIGLQAFDHLELEVVRSGYSPEDLVDRLFNCAHYLLDHGPVLKDGDTFGLSAEEKIEVRHLPSKLGRPGKVIQLQFADSP
jgi:hypothetical protein